MTIANRLPLPFSHRILETGLPASGYKFKFYESGASTTPQSAYTGYDGSTLSGAVTSVTLNALGLPDVDIYLDPTLNYRVVVTDSADTPVNTYDNVRDFGLNAAARFKLYAGNPNGNVAGIAGTAGGSPSDVIYDTTNGIVWVCTTTGTAGTAVWTNTSASLTGAVSMTGVLSPASFSTTQNNYNPTDLSTASSLRLNPGASSAITGLAGGASGRQMTLFNISATYNIILRDQDSASDAANRFALANGQDVVLLPNYSCTLQYDTTTGRWRLKNPPFAQLKLPRGYIDGCILSNGTDTTNDINIAAGVCRDSTDSVDITLPALAGKQLDAGWALGASAGMRNSAIAIANTTYHIYAVATIDNIYDQTSDIYAHTSTTVSTVLTALTVESGGGSYVYARRIGSIVRAGGTILQFVQRGDKFRLKTPVLDASNTDTANDNAVTITLASLPTGLVLEALLHVVVSNMSAGAIISALTDTDSAPSLTVAPLGTNNISASGTPILGVQVEVFTDTSAQVRFRGSNAAGTAGYWIASVGWTDSRGKDS